MASTTPTVRREAEAKEGEEKSGKGAIYGVREEWPLLEGGGGHFNFHLIGVAAGNTVASIGIVWLTRARVSQSRLLS